MTTVPKDLTRARFGRVAEKYRKLVKDIYSQGHEIASHGYSHALVFNMTRESFGEDIRKTKNILEDITGERIFGYRAPSYSITSKNLWAIDILIQEGCRYDSSIFPIHHDLYGFPDFSRFPVIMETDSGSKLLEVPRIYYSRIGTEYSDMRRRIFSIVPTEVYRVGDTAFERKRTGSRNFLYPSVGA